MMGKMDAHLRFAGPKKAAAMLDLSQADFLRLVGNGALPPPVKIGDEFERWSVRQIEDIINGAAISGEFET